MRTLHNKVSHSANTEIVLRKKIFFGHGLYYPLFREKKDNIILPGNTIQQKFLDSVAIKENTIHFKKDTIIQFLEINIHFFSSQDNNIHDKFIKQKMDNKSNLEHYPKCGYNIHRWILKSCAIIGNKTLKDSISRGLRCQLG